MDILRTEITCSDPPEVPFATLVFDSIVEHGNAIALVNPLTNETRTFEEVASAIEKVSSSLQMEGLSNGDRVAFCVPNSIEACISLLAVSRCGATITLANPLYTQRELEHFVEVAEPTHWFCTSAVIPRISVTHGLRKIFVFDTNKETREKYVTYDELLHANVNLDFLPPKINLDDIATMPFSSGTTGLPKGVMLTHRNLVAALTQAKSWLHDLNKGDTCVGFLPLFHQYGLMLSFYCLMRGVKLILMPRFSLTNLLEYIQKFKITVIPLVPPVALQLAKNPIVDNYDVSSIKCIINSAAALTAEMAELVNKRLNASVKQGYGLTETTFATHYTSGSVKAGAIGKLLPFVEAKIADIETNTSLGPNQDGEILVRGPLIMKGYRHNIEETRNCIDENGWLHTGDIGYYDDSLCFWYKDRKKELIKYNAYQVPPAELEGLLAAHPEVVDAAVVGVPDATSGELPRAYIVKRKDSNVTANQIADYIAENVAPFKKLRGGVVFTDIIPRSASGKILRRELKAKMTKELK